MGKFLIKATIFDKKNNVLSEAVNSYTKTHPIQAYYANKTSKPSRIYLHAEIAALVKLRKGAMPFRIKVERYNKEGNPANARPCDVCQAAIRHWGINFVEYTC